MSRSTAVGFGGRNGSRPLVVPESGILRIRYLIAYLLLGYLKPFEFADARRVG
jgi:hypothetical protein